jgi:uncharacterized protein (DUF362 family)
MSGDSRGRRKFLQGTGALVAASTVAGSSALADESKDSAIDALTAHPPAGFSPMSAPGKVTKVTKGTDPSALLQPNKLWPKPDVAKEMLERAMTEFTGASNLVEAMKRFVHPDDVVAIKVNGIAGQSGFTMAVNFELILPVVEAVIAAGVPADKVTVYEQFPNFLSGTRVNIRGNKLPDGVRAKFHGNSLATMPYIQVYQGIRTKYCRFLTEATAVINMSLIKDHSICGYTGLLKNITHGSIINPHDHHTTHANPQIALLYNHPIVRSRVRLHITDGFKLIYDEGPLDKNPRRRIPHGAVYVSTDPVAMDTIGWKVIDDVRQAKGMRTLAKSGREPTYIRTAADLGIGIHDMNRIRLREVAI